MICCIFSVLAALSAVNIAFHYEHVLVTEMSLLLCDLIKRDTLEQRIISMSA